jgi:hypothetical protein
MRENKAALREELTRVVEAYDGPITRKRNTGRVTVRCQICHSRRTVPLSSYAGSGCGARNAAALCGRRRNERSGRALR